MKALRPAWILGLVLAIGTASSLAPRVSAFVGEAHQTHDIDLLQQAPTLSKAQQRDVTRRLQAAPAWRQWQRTNPGWQVQWDLQTQTAHRAWGPGVRVTGGPPTQDSIEQQSLELVQRTAPWTGIDASQLRLVQARKRLERWYVIFEQVVDGVPVYGGRVDLRIAGNGNLMMLGADWVEAPVRTTQRALDISATLRAAQLDFDTPALIPESQRTVLVPVPGAQGTVLRLADLLVFRTEQPSGRWTALVDAVDGRLLKRENQHRYAEVVGNISAQVQESTPTDPFQLHPLQDTRLNIESGLTEFGNTDANGDFSVTTASVDSVNVFTRLAGPFARIYNDELGRVTPRIDAKALPGSPIDFVWDDSNSRASERDAYRHTLLAHDFIKELDPAFTGVDYVMPVVVDIGGRECNAWWDGWGINFLLPGQRCVNTAQIADVVYHEYGHGITDWQYRPFAPSGAMHEGFSDYLAATMRNDPKIGNGFFGPGSSIRTVDNDRRVPDDVTGQVHNDGLILAGALWDVRALLGAARTDTLFHFARYGLSDNFDDYMLDVLVTDDDNGNIFDGTPNIDLIIAAFASHGIGDYSVQISHDGLPDTEDTAKPLLVSTQILSLFPLDTGTLMLHYRIDEGAWSPIALSDAGAVRQFEAMLPLQSSGTAVDYYIEASDNQGTASRWPGPEPTDMHRFVIGPDTTPPQLASEALSDRPIDSQGWTVRATVTDNLDLGVAGVDLLWSRGNDALSNTVPMTQVDGALWTGDIPTGALMGDTMHYALVATDSAMSANTTRLPGSGSRTFKVVQGFFRDFEANNGTFVPSGEWEWGVPTLGPDAWSGTRVWATALDEGYENDTVADLQVMQADMGTWQSGALSFLHWYAIEDFWDGGRVEISSDNGLSWQLLVPDGGYPWSFIDALNSPGFSGETPDWQRVEFDLSQYLGMQVLIRLHFESDGGLTDLGWYVDDLEVVERQVLALPLHLAGTDGVDGSVPLQWMPPAGIDPQQVGTPLLGYNVYRGLLPDLSDASKVNASLVTDAWYDDDSVVNGTRYTYAVTAVYASGESPLSGSVTALPYRAIYETSLEDLVVQAAAGAGVDTALTFDNTGTGFLFLNAWVGDSGQSIDDVRIAWDPSMAAPPPTAATMPLAKQTPRSRPSATPASTSSVHGGLSDTALRQRFAAQKPRVARLQAAAASAALGAVGRTPEAAQVPEYTVLFLDPMDSTGPADLNEFAVGEEFGSLFYRITGHANWGNILTDFTLIISIDADANRSTGDPNGSDFHVLVGAFPMQVVQAPAFISNNDQEIVGIPWHVVVPNNASHMEVGFASAIFGDVGQMFHSAAALSNDLQTQHDGMPDPASSTSWLSLTDTHLTVEANAPQSLRFSLASGLTPNAYDANLLLDTNDPAKPVAQVAVQFRSGVTPVSLQDFTATQERDGVTLSWHSAIEEEVAFYRIFRSRDGGAFEALQPDIALTPDRRYHFRDRQVDAGRYAYRVGEVAAGGEVTLHGLVEIDVVQAAPRRTFMDPNAPNPFNPKTTISYGVDRDGPVQLDVFDARGRLVRTLVRHANLPAGYHRAVWDGRDQRGRSVASGIYHARLVVNGRHLTQRMTLLK